jgi:molecular chaperone HtpG
MAETIIGKNVLESLTRSMYADSRCVYREYIQNAADQIDAAKQIHPELEYAVYVRIDPYSRNVIIEDDATGVKAEDIKALLIDVARSIKIRGVNKGFRGIGRLGGLAYCDTLKFETSYFDEDIVSTVTWDAVRLNEILDDDDDDRDAGAVIDEIVSVRNEQRQEAREKHYFRVIMENVTEEKLLKEKDIRDYLAMVAPLDYSNHFVYRKKIYDFMKEHDLHLDCYNIFVGDNQLSKDYTMSILDQSGQIEDTITGIEFWYEQNAEGQPMYWGWYSISSLKGILNKTNKARNIRLRCENIQLGDETACYHFMPSGDKARFVRYFFGEIHVLPTSNLVPDSHRDYLRVDAGLKEFENSVEAHLLELEALCYGASDARKADKTIKQSDEKEQQIQKRITKGVTSPAQRQKLEEDLGKLRSEREKATKKLRQIHEKWKTSGNPLINMFSPVGIQLPQAPQQTQQLPVSTPQQSVTIKLRTDDKRYGKFQQKEKELILAIYNVIEQTLNNEKERDALIDKIEREITK